jgi:hypothetical protein
VAVRCKQHVAEWGASAEHECVGVRERAHTHETRFITPPPLHTLAPRWDVRHGAGRRNERINSGVKIIRTTTQLGAAEPRTPTPTGAPTFMAWLPPAWSRKVGETSQALLMP